MKAAVIFRFALAALGSLLAASPARATVTVEFSAGAACKPTKEPVVIPFRIGQPAKASVCLTTTVEAVCGFTLHLEAASPDESARFHVLKRDLGAGYPDPTLEKLPPRVAVASPGTREDFGGTVQLPGKAIAPAAGQLLATFTLAPDPKADKPEYTLRIGAGSVVVVGKRGRCDDPDEVPIQGAVTLQAISLK